MSIVTAGISVHDLHKRLHEKNEFALLDVREQEEFSRSHILLACCVPSAASNSASKRSSPAGRPLSSSWMTAARRTSTGAPAPPRP
ncbi:rhodanese-like domain-containing protein [Desulfovibrio sp.]|uniref:rhodanese-like domain-containing protein n=1 Tax=Desulfovibrio sp. TaxID=885 RepID=UPI00338F507D|nr:hypothetical protein [Desulfovibrio sp.]